MFCSNKWLVILSLSALISAYASWAFASSPPPSLINEYDDSIRSAVNQWWPDYPDWLYWKAQLYQESQLNPRAMSPVGAAGLAQFMPGTWADVSRQLGYGEVSPYVAKYAIDAGAYYMAKLRAGWTADRSPNERQKLAQASYNTGAGNVLKAQRLCGNARLWQDIQPCLSRVTGASAGQQTSTYVIMIQHWWKEMNE